ncbi:MAG: 3-hexulose-6-phosphate synthase [Candidatus Lokiarchaeota archaeon]|nr:3-hexulose-6-phosphate synthase [Candidatus Lokiarchaeota archaeon]
MNTKEQQKEPLLQVALDFINLEEALTIAEKVAPFVDILEAGTPLIKSEGISVVQTLKKLFPDKQICADLKTADAGYLEAQIAAQSKADIITVLADAYNVTIQETLHAARDYNIKVMADLIVSRRPIKRLAEIIDLEFEGIKIHYALVHSGLDRQASRHKPLSDLKSVAELMNHPPLAIAGGIQVSDISTISQYPLEIIIVGGAITRAKDPKLTAETIRKKISNIRWSATR